MRQVHWPLGQPHSGCHLRELGCDQSPVVDSPVVLRVSHTSAVQVLEASVGLTPVAAVAYYAKGFVEAATQEATLGVLEGDPILNL